jgi:NmrA-like family protein
LSHSDGIANADKNTGIPHFESKYKVEQHIRNLGVPYTIIGPTFFMENLHGPGLEQGQLTLPLSPSSILQQSALENSFFVLDISFNLYCYIISL